MRQLHSTILLAILLSVVGTKSFAHDIEATNADGVILYYNFINDKTELEVTYRGYIFDFSSVGYSGNVTIPSSVTHEGKTYSVTSIGAYVFYDCSGLLSINIPNNVTYIGDGAFYNCSGLTSITIPSGVTSIGNNAFSYCSGLTSITIPSSVTSIETSFVGCTNLESIKVEAGNPVYDSRENCNAIIQTADGVLIAACNNTHIPNGVTSIGNMAFALCSGLASLTIPSGVTSIGISAFSYCSGLTSITIPSGVTSIGNNAFSYCSGLTSITIPSSVTYIGESAFTFCNKLESITVETGNPVYDSRENCNAIIRDSVLVAGCKSTKIPNSVTSIGSFAFYGHSEMTSITIPNSVKSLGTGALANCSGLISLTLPNSVTSIGDGTFYRCDGLEAISVEAGNPVYDSRENCNAIIETNKYGSVGVRLGCKNTRIPESVTSIFGSAFDTCTGLTSIVIHDKVTFIGGYAFRGCTGLTSVTFGSGVKTIEERAFKDCPNLKTLCSLNTTPPNCVTTVFDEDHFTTVNVFVPHAALEKYQSAATWKRFASLQGSDFTGIENVKVENEKVSYYDLKGNRLNVPKRGLNIVNGKKVIVNVK